MPKIQPSAGQLNVEPRVVCRCPVDLGEPSGGRVDLLDLMAMDTAATCFAINISAAPCRSALAVASRSAALSSAGLRFGNRYNTAASELAELIALAELPVELMAWA
jgi:hypothetical protein